MTIGRNSRLFKFSIIALIAVIFVFATTRNGTPSDGSNLQDEDFKNRSGQENKIDKENISMANNSVTVASLVPVEEKPVEETTTEITEPPSVKNDVMESYLLEEYDKMPGAFLQYKIPAPQYETYCKFNYEMPFALQYNDTDLAFPPQEGNRSQYRILYNVTEAHSVENVPQVTYCTHMTANFANFLTELLERWDGLVTLAAYVPDMDAAIFLEQINHFCYCDPEMYRVSIHIITHKLMPFSTRFIGFDRPATCAPMDSSKIPTYKDYDDSLTYQVNIMRNTARTSALTKYVLLSDIELMPSKNMASKFLQFVSKYPKTNPKQVFVVPIFEVEKNYSIPENKGQLLKLLADQKAVYFHGLVCNRCQKFPGIERWLETGYTPEIKALLEAKRHTPYHSWEPLFIGTNAEPLYSEQLSWEGLLDKMLQSLEMCLQNYTYVILDNAFLCHWPGIKREPYKNRFPNLVEKNRKFYIEKADGFLKRYSNIKECNVNLVANMAKKQQQEKNAH